MRVGGNCLKYLKRGWNRKLGRGYKNFKKEGQAGARSRCLEGGTGTPLQTVLDSVDIKAPDLAEK